ncbi:hypothetical protein CXG81DRAFT_3995, partial [Caulochytrium protostelioides]
EGWRMSQINAAFLFAPTYPDRLVVPARLSDNVLKHAGAFRSKCRIPVLSYVHPDGTSITRSAQPFVGLQMKRSIQDEKLVKAIFQSHLRRGPRPSEAPPRGSRDLILDARPQANALGQTAMGAGTENADLYECDLHFLGIENIHVVRDTHLRVLDALHPCFCERREQRSALIHGMIARTGWTKHIRTILEGARFMVSAIQHQRHVLVHCSDGWDRTAQLCSLAALCADPFYRTTRGFMVLFEKEWASFGHKFRDRGGLLTKRPEVSHHTPLSLSGQQTTQTAALALDYTPVDSKESAPIISQYLDCVYQLMVQYPTAFEFGPPLLAFLNTHAFSGMFDIALANCEAER